MRSTMISVFAEIEARAGSRSRSPENRHKRRRSDTPQKGGGKVTVRRSRCWGGRRPSIGGEKGRQRVYQGMARVDYSSGICTKRTLRKRESGEEALLIP